MPSAAHDRSSLFILFDIRGLPPGQGPQMAGLMRMALRYGTVRVLKAPAARHDDWAAGDTITCPDRDVTLLAGPQRILVSDKPWVLDEWRAAGGIAVAHDGDFEQTARRLSTCRARPGPPARPEPS